MKFSIILPVFNTKPMFLTKCINSVLKQTYHNYELLIINDGSINEAPNIVELFASENKEVRAFHKKNEGVSAARNLGIKEAKGEYLIFLDDDDWLEINCLEVLDKELSKHNLDILIFSNYVNTRSKEMKNPHFKESIYKFYPKLKQELELKTMVLSHPHFTFNPPMTTLGSTWGKAINREFLLETKVKFKKELVRAQDIIFYIYLFQYTNNIAYIKKYLYHYRLNTESAVSKYRCNSVEIMTRVMDEFKKFILKYKKPEIFWVIYRLRAITTIRICTTVDFFHPENPKTYIERMSDLKKMLNSEPYSSSLKNIDFNIFSVKDKIYIYFLKKRNILGISIFKFLGKYKHKNKY